MYAACGDDWCTISVAAHYNCGKLHIIGRFVDNLLVDLRAYRVQGRLHIRCIAGELCKRFARLFLDVRHLMTAPPPGLAADRETLSELVAANYPSISHGILRPILELSRISRAVCGGDMDKYLIMLVVAVRTTEHPAFGSYSQAQLLSGEIPVFPSLGTNVQSIADSTQMPKETVRRKVCELVDAGWIARDGSDLRFTAKAYQQLAEVRVAIEQLVVRNFEVVARLLRNAASASGRAS